MGEQGRITENQAAALAPDPGTQSLGLNRTQKNPKAHAVWGMMTYPCLPLKSLNLAGLAMGPM